MGTPGNDILKNGILWRGFKGSAIFGLGFYTHVALASESTSMVKEVKQKQVQVLADCKSMLNDAKQAVVEAKSIQKRSWSILAEAKEATKFYTSGMTELEDIKKADVESGSESQEETEGGYYGAEI